MDIVLIWVGRQAKFLKIRKNIGHGKIGCFPSGCTSAPYPDEANGLSLSLASDRRYSAPQTACPPLIDQAVNLPIAPKAKRVAWVFAAPFDEKVIDRLTDQRRARPLLCFRQFVQLPKLGIVDINRYPHRVHHEILLQSVASPLVLTPLTFVRASAAVRSAPQPEFSIRGAVSRPFSS